MTDTAFGTRTPAISPTPCARRLDGIGLSNARDHLVSDASGGDDLVGGFIAEAAIGEHRSDTHPARQGLGQQRTQSVSVVRVAETNIMGAHDACGCGTDGSFVAELA